MRFFLPLALALWATTAPAQTPQPAQSFLAQNGLEKTIAQLAADPAANSFETGMLLTLRALEKTLQTRYEYGLGDSLSQMPLFRLDFGEMKNPAPAKSNPATLTAIMNGFVGDMGKARAALEMAQSEGINPFEMTLQDIWFDINSNGTQDAAENAFTLLGPVVLGRRAYRELQKSDTPIPPITIRFDAADQAWLMAYTHMLSGFGNLFMAFDPEPVLRNLYEQRASLAEAPVIPNIYDPVVVNKEIAALKAEADALKSQMESVWQRLDTINTQRNALRAEIKAAEDEAQKATLQAALDKLMAERQEISTKQRSLSQEQRLVGDEIHAAKMKLPHSPDFRSNPRRDRDLKWLDPIYVAIESLAQTPDPARIRAAHADLLAMIQHNRTFWDRLADETDNEREWIPNATQQSAMPFDIPPRLAEGWQAILKDVEDMLNGNLLIHHPLLPEGYGISVPAYVANPSSLDLIGWIHGVAAYRYAAKGPRLTDQSWQAFRRLTGGNAGGFALFLN